MSIRLDLHVGQHGETYAYQLHGGVGGTVAISKYCRWRVGEFGLKTELYVVVGWSVWSVLVGVAGRLIAVSRLVLQRQLLLLRTQKRRRGVDRNSANDAF